MPRQQRGFTLLEIMVVLVIMSILVGFAVLGLGSSGYDKQLNEEIRRLNARVSLATENAILEGRDLGLGFAAHGYQFYELTENQWQALGTDDLLKKVELDDTTELQLRLEDTDIVMSAKLPEKPQIFILSSGENTPFELEIRTRQDDQLEPKTIAFDLLGRRITDDQR